MRHNVTRLSQSLPLKLGKKLFKNSHKGILMIEILQLNPSNKKKIKQIAEISGRNSLV